jgi:hypothetical protein
MAPSEFTLVIQGQTRRLQDRCEFRATVLRASLRRIVERYKVPPYSCAMSRLAEMTCCASSRTPLQPFAAVA